MTREMDGWTLEDLLGKGNTEKVPIETENRPFLSPGTYQIKCGKLYEKEKAVKQIRRHTDSLFFDKVSLIITFTFSNRQQGEEIHRILKKFDLLAEEM